MNIKQKIAVVVINILVLAELAFSIYLGSRDQDMVITFLKTYIPALIITLIAGKFCIKRLGESPKAPLQLP